MNALHCKVSKKQDTETKKVFAVISRGLVIPIRMSHCCIPATDGAEFWISCNRLKELRKAGRLQMIQNKRPWFLDVA